MLYAGMYSDPNCKLFDLSYGQLKANPLIASASWYSEKGDRLGSGDLIITDLQKIHQSLPLGEGFFVVPELASLNLPSGLSWLNPGLKWIIDNAAWIITMADIYKIDDSILNQEVSDKEGVSYVKITRTTAKSFFSPSPGSKNTYNVSCVKEVIMNSYWGLDVYKMFDGSMWAVGDYSSCHNAAIKVIESHLWKNDPSTLTKFLHLTSEDLYSIGLMQDYCKEKSNGIIRKLLGNDYLKYCESILSKASIAYYLDPIDSKEYYSDQINGLPTNLLAYRVD